MKGGNNQPNTGRLSEIFSEGREMKKTMTIAIVVILIITSVSAAMIAAGDRSGPEDEGTVTLNDMLGVEVTVKKNPTVACTSRTTYDLLIAFGLGEYVDGAYFALYNSWTGTLNPDSEDDYRYAYNESYETFYARGIDLILAPEAYISENLREHGLTAMTVSLYGNPDFGGFVYYIADMAVRLWDCADEKVSKWKSDMTTVLSDIRSVLDEKGYADKDLYYIRGDKNKGVCYTDNRGSFNEWIFEQLGFNFIGSGFETNTPSVEALLEADPDVIVIGGQYQYVLERSLNDATWSEIAAVKNGSVYRIPVGITPFEQISTFSPEFICQMANVLYPEYFDYDVSSMVIEHCRYYFGVTLTEEQAGNMLNGLDIDGNRLV